MIDLVHRTGKNYYPQVFSEECKYVEKKMHEYITDDIGISSDEENSDYSNEKNSNEETSDEESNFE